MSYQDHLKTCPDCQRTNLSQKPTVRIKGASAYRKERKLSELASIIKGTSYSTISYPESFKKVKTKAASSVEKSQKLKELGKMIKGL